MRPWMFIVLVFTGVTVYIILALDLRSLHSRLRLLRNSDAAALALGVFNRDNDVHASESPIDESFENEHPFVTFQNEYEGDEVRKQDEYENWGQKFYYDENVLICVMPTMWHQQESWMVAMETWLKDCDRIMFFVDLNDNSLHHFRRHFKANNSYHSLNTQNFESEYEWLFNPDAITKPTVFLNPNIDDPLDLKKTYPDLKLDYQVDISPFPFCNQTHFWIVPLNHFILNELFDDKKQTENNCSMWQNDDDSVDPDGSHNLEMWDKEASMYLFIYRYFRNDANWILKLDSDSLVLIPNMKAYLLFYNPRVPHYLGGTQFSRINKGLKTVPCGGSYYVVSMRALERLVPELLYMEHNPAYFQKYLRPNSLFDEHTMIQQMESKQIRSLCMRSNRVSEDVMMSLCLRNVGILPEETRDTSGSARFTFLTYDTWKSQHEKKRWHNNIPLAFHPYKIEILGRNKLAEIWSQIYDELIVKNRQRIDQWWNFDNISGQSLALADDFLVAPPQTFQYGQNAQKNNKRVNVSLFVEKAQNCKFCTSLYPKCVQKWMNV